MEPLEYDDEMPVADHPADQSPDPFDDFERLYR